MSNYNIFRQALKGQPLKIRISYRWDYFITYLLVEWSNFKYIFTGKNDKEKCIGCGWYEEGIKCPLNKKIKNKCKSWKDETLMDLEDELEDLTGFFFSISKIKNEETVKLFGDGYGLDIYFNDMFCWATSVAMCFIPENNKTLEDLINEFKLWFYGHGVNYKKRFDAVKYPNHEEKSYEDDLEYYFDENCKIGKDLELSLNAYCNKKLNDNLV